MCTLSYVCNLCACVLFVDTSGDREEGERGNLDGKRRGEGRKGDCEFMSTRGETEIVDWVGWLVAS